MLPLLALCCAWFFAVEDGGAIQGGDRPDRKAPGITALASAPDGSGWLLGSQAGVVFRTPDDARERPIPTGLDHIHALAFSPDGSTLAVAGGSPGEFGTVELLSWPAGDLLGRLGGHEDVVYNVAWIDGGEALATAGAFECLGLSRREAIWLAGSAAQDRVEFLPDSLISVQPPLFPDPSSYERLAADLWATGISTDDHPMTHYRSGLDSRGVLTSGDLRTSETGRRVEVAGLVTHRQRPATASGVTFLNLEDEHGLVNVICSVGMWNRYRRVVRDAPALIVRGILERSAEGVTNLLADRFEDLRVEFDHRSRDFR